MVLVEVGEGVLLALALVVVAVAAETTEAAEVAAEVAAAVRWVAVARCRRGWRGGIRPV